MDIKKLVGFKIHAADARISILGFTEILRSKDHGYANPGEENNDLGIQDQNNHTVPHTPEAELAEQESHNEPAPNTDANETMNIGRRQTNLPLGPTLLQPAEPLHLTSNQPDRDHQTQTPVLPSEFSNELNQSTMEQQSYDVWPPFFYPTIADVLPDSEMLNLPQVDMGSIDMDYFEPENWFMSTNP